MHSGDARTVAERVHAHHREPDGTPLLRHIERVVSATPPEGRPIAWLHEALEWGAITEQELLMLGLTDDGLRALRLVTHPFPWRTDHAYLAHVDLIARASGSAGHLARMVKIADLNDRRRHPGVRLDGRTPPYDRALERLRSAELVLDGAAA